MSRPEPDAVALWIAATVQYHVITSPERPDLPAEVTAVEAHPVGELEAVAAALRRLTRMGPADRRRLARLMVGSGMTQREVAVRLGVSERTIWRDLGHP